MSQNVASKNVVMHNIQEADDTLNEKKTSTEENLEDVLPGSYLAALLNGTTQSKNNANNSSGESIFNVFSQDCYMAVNCTSFFLKPPFKSKLTNLALL